MKFLPHQLTDAIRRMLPPEEKKRLGVAALTMSELIDRVSVKTERDLQNQVAAFLRLKDIPFYTSRMDRRTTNRVGQPDFLCCVPPRGILLGLECKLPGEEPTEDQWREIKAIKAAGGIAWVVHSLAEVKSLFELKSILDELQKP